MKITKTLFLTLAATASISNGFAQPPAASDGRDVGNGGGAWVCRSRAAPRSITWMQVVDLFEAETEFRLTLETYTGTVQEIVARVLGKLELANRPLYEAIEPRVAQLGGLEDHPPYVIQTRQGLTAINEGPYRVFPQARCARGSMAAEPEQVVNYKHDGSVLVQRNLFESLPSNTERAALVIHEAVYAYRRSAFHDSNSSPSRRITGLLMSTLSATEIAAQLEALGLARSVIYSDLYSEFSHQIFLSTNPTSVTAPSPVSDAELTTTLAEATALMNRLYGPERESPRGLISEMAQLAQTRYREFFPRLLCQEELATAECVAAAQEFAAALAQNLGEIGRSTGAQQIDRTYDFWNGVIDLMSAEEENRAVDGPCF